MRDKLIRAAISDMLRISPSWRWLMIGDVYGRARFLCALARGCGAISINQSRVLRAAPPVMMHLPRDIVINRNGHRPHVCKGPSLRHLFSERTANERFSKQILRINHYEKLALKLGLYNFLDSSKLYLDQPRCRSRAWYRAFHLKLQN